MTCYQESQVDEGQQLITRSGLEVIKIFMFNSTEHETFPADKY